jgi:2,3-dihydroxyphenylpropionate 1,2-dioxygenase
MNVDAPSAQGPAIARFRSGVEELRRRIHAARPDAVIVFAPDHFRSQFYENMPAFCIGVGELNGWGDWNTPVGPFPVQIPLARHILRALLRAGFDPSQSHRLRVDHGFTQPLDLLALTHVPIVPIIINAAAPPLPPLWRTHSLGLAVGAALRSFEGDLRVAIIGSGGLSHGPPSLSVESTDPADAVRVERMIAGRQFVLSDAAAREASLIATVDRYSGRINPAWDRAILSALAAGDGATIARQLDDDAIERDGGNGGQEIRTWIAAAAAAGDARMDILCYEPIPFFITGMGAVVTSA